MSDHPWGLSGPTFLVMYGSTLATLVCLILVLRFVGQRHNTTADTASLSVYERAYLYGGAGNVADTALARLLDAGAVRAHRNRTVSSITTAAPDRFQQLLLDQLATTTATLPVLRKTVRRSHLCTPLHQRLREQSLLAPAACSTAVAAVSYVALPLLVVVGIARMLTGAALGYPIGGLIAELVGALIAMHLSIIAFRGPLRTRAGTAARTRAVDETPLPMRRWAHSATIGEHALQRSSTDPDADELVPVHGFIGYPDLTITPMLVPPHTGSSASGVTAGASGFGGGFGGGGCGGGGP